MPCIETALPELSPDIMNNGIMLTDGGALLNGFDKLLRTETGLPVSIADNPLECVAIGVGKALDDINRIKQANSHILIKCKRRDVYALLSAEN